MNTKSCNASKFDESKSCNASKFDDRKSFNTSRFDERKSSNPPKFDDRKPCNASKFDERKSYNASKFDERKSSNTSKYDERKSSNSSKFDERRRITHRHHQNEYVGPETSKIFKKKLSSYNGDRVARSEHCRGYLGAKRNTYNNSQNNENSRFGKRNGSFQLQPHDSYHKDPHASKSSTADNLVKVSQSTIVKLTDLELKNIDTNGYNYNHSRKVDNSISEDWDEECFKSKNNISLPCSSSSPLDIKQNKCNLEPSLAALVSTYQDLIQLPSEPSNKISQLAVDKKELIIKSVSQAKDLGGKKDTSQSCKGSSHKEAEVQVHLNTNCQHSPQDLKAEESTYSLTQIKHFHNSSFTSDKEKISKEENTDVSNNSQMSIADVKSDPIEVCTYDTCSAVSSDLEAEICSQSDEGEFTNAHEVVGVEENCKMEKLLKPPEPCHPVIQESPGSSNGFPIESLSLPASSFGSKESLDKVTNFMRSCAVKMFEFISSRQHLPLNALITVSIPDITHNNSTCYSVDKVYPHCFQEAHKSKVEESSLFHHLFPFPSMPYLMPPYWQWNYWPEWHSPPIVAPPHTREHDYCTSDEAESVGPSHGAQINHSIGLETGCVNNLHLQSDRPAMKNIEDDDLSAKASQSKTFGPNSLPHDLKSTSEHNFTGESTISSSATSSLNQTKNTQAAFLQRKQLPRKRTDKPVQQQKEKFSLTIANTCNSHVFNRNEFIPLPAKKTPSCQKVPINSFESSHSNSNAFMPAEHPTDGYNLTDGELNLSGPNAKTFMPTMLPKDGHSTTERNIIAYGPNATAYSSTPPPKRKCNLAVGNFINSYSANAYMSTQLPRDGYSMTEGNFNVHVPTANTFTPTLFPRDGYRMTEGNSNTYGPNAYMSTLPPKDGYSMTEGNFIAYGPNAYMSTPPLKDGYGMTEGNFNAYVPNAYMSTPPPKDGYSMTERNLTAYGPNANAYMSTPPPKDGYSMTERNFTAYGPNANSYMSTPPPKDGYSMTERNFTAYGPNANAYMSIPPPKDNYSMIEGNFNAGPNANIYMPTLLSKGGPSMIKEKSNAYKPVISIAYNPNANAYIPSQLPKDGYNMSEGNFNAYTSTANPYIATQVIKEGYNMTEKNFNAFASTANAYMPNQVMKDGYSLTEGNNSNVYSENAITYMPTQQPKDGYSLTGHLKAFDPNTNTYIPTQLPKAGYQMAKGKSNTYNPNANTYMPTQNPKDEYSMTEGNSNTYNPNANTYMPIQNPKDEYSMTKGNSNTYNPNGNTHMPTQNTKTGNGMIEGDLNSCGSNETIFMPSQLPKDGCTLTDESKINTSSQTAIKETSSCKTDLEEVADEYKKSQGHLEACQENFSDKHVNCDINSESDSLMLPGAHCDENQSEANCSDHTKQEQSGQLSSAVERHPKTNSTKTLQPGITLKNHIKSKYRLGSNLNILRKPLHFPKLLPKMAISLVSRFKGSDSLHWRNHCKPLEPLRPSPKASNSPKENFRTDVGDHKLENKSSINTETSSQKGTPPTSRWKHWNFSPSYWSPPESPSKSVDKQSQWTQEFISKSKTYKNTFIDSHCHLDFLYQRLNLESTPFKQFKEENADYFPANYEGCLAVFCNPKTFAAEKPQNNIVNLLSEEEGVWFSFGCHPKNALEFKDSHEVGLRKILSHPKVVSLGEIGLDYSGNFIQNAEIQKNVFKRQLLIAVELKLPIVIHCRDADDDCLQILQEIVPHDHRIHAHCFTRSMDVAVRWLTAFPNLFIGLTPLISYKTAMNAANTASFIPLDRLLLETDAPYFVPRTKQRIDAKFSYPGFALFTAEKLAELKGLPVDVILKSCRENTRKMYGI